MFCSQSPATGARWLQARKPIPPQIHIECVPGAQEIYVVDKLPPTGMVRTLGNGRYKPGCRLRYLPVVPKLRGKSLQSENIDVSNSIEIIDKTRQPMVEMRSAKMFQQVLVEARDFCNSIETEAEFKVPEVRALKKKKQYDYESLEEASPNEIQAKGLFSSIFYFGLQNQLFAGTIRRNKGYI
ncbi:hypothetical protein AVEN_131300-1 [Araneus ventricosus]|uniref:Uncharacterized protein n=1 Tax=Araneus ventricosus TaxID=182803 RepID=A0A4Y2HF74_ARAVE|nr:hypothetical protein AVEN_131300-1 [Araneus ventricosus]